jgi:hypothetical protein
VPSFGCRLFGPKRAEWERYYESRPPQSAILPIVIGRYERCPCEIFVGEECAV